MNEKEIESLMQRFDSIPSIIVYQVSGDQLEELMHIIPKEINLNPIEVVLQSILNVKIEQNSEERVTLNKDILLINDNTVKEAVEELATLIESDNTILKKIHSMWMQKFMNFIIDLYKKDEKMKMEELIFKLCKHFRISSLSAIKSLNNLFTTKPT